MDPFYVSIRPTVQQKFHSGSKSGLGRLFLVNQIWLQGPTMAAKISPAQPKMVQSRKLIEFMPFALLALCATCTLYNYN